MSDVVLCRHVPGPVNRWCDRCPALIIAGSILAGPCGHERFFPPGFEWAPRSWCPGCERFKPFGVQPLAPRAVVLTPPFWRGDFATTPEPVAARGRPVAARPLNLLELGRALAWPTVSDLHRRLGTPDRVYWYRWRRSGLSVDHADTLAINACLHPIEVWGEAWEAA